MAEPDPAGLGSRCVAPRVASPALVLVLVLCMALDAPGGIFDEFGFGSYRRPPRGVVRARVTGGQAAYYNPGGSDENGANTTGLYLPADP